MRKYKSFGLKAKVKFEEISKQLKKDIFFFGSHGYEIYYPSKEDKKIILGIYPPKAPEVIDKIKPNESFVRIDFYEPIDRNDFNIGLFAIGYIMGLINADIEIFDASIYYAEGTEHYFG